MRPGDLVEFWSSRNGGEWRRGDRTPTGGSWLPAVVAPRQQWGDYNEEPCNGRLTTSGGLVRLETGPGVYILRLATRCRLRKSGEGPDGAQAAGRRRGEGVAALPTFTRAS